MMGMMLLLLCQLKKQRFKIRSQKGVVAMFYVNAVFSHKIVLIKYY